MHENFSMVNDQSMCTHHVAKIKRYAKISHSTVLGLEKDEFRVHHHTDQMKTLQALSTTTLSKTAMKDWKRAGRFSCRPS